MDSLDSNEIADEFINQNSRCDHKTYFVVEMGGCELWGVEEAGGSILKDLSSPCLNTYVPAALLSADP